jgi:tetratricopeptide (TPR) repeat protein
MRRWAKIVLANGMIGLMFIAFVAADQPARQFVAGVEGYKSGQYAVAIAHFRAMVQDGLVNAGLYYNLANAYLKNGDLGPAILWYERALRLAPADPDLNFNLAYARSLVRDDPGDAPVSAARVLFFWQDHISGRTLRVLTVVCNFVFWTTLAVWVLTRRAGVKRVMWVFLAVTVILAATSALSFSESVRPRRAIVLAERIAVRSGLEESSTQLFELHAGAKVRLLRRMKGHCQIRFGQDKIGWVEKAVVGTIE